MINTEFSQDNMFERKRKAMHALYGDYSAFDGVTPQTSSHYKPTCNAETATELAPNPKVVGQAQKRQTNQTRPKRNTHASPIAVLFTIAVLLLACYVSAMFLTNINSVTTYHSLMPSPVLKISKANAKAPGAEDEYKAMCVLETNSGRVLYGKNEDEKLPMASTTKIATAIVTIENAPDLNAKIKIPAEAVGVEGSSIYLRGNEELTIKELLFGLMLASGNDASVALSVGVFGSVENAIAKMNELAQKLNLTNTHFVTPHGLHDDNHYTTARDLATLTAYANQNETFREIVGTKRITLPNINDKNPRYLKNKQKLMFDETLEKNGILVTGTKSGYTPEAGRCLVTTADVNGLNLVVVVLNAPDMFASSQKLIEKTGKEYKRVELLKPYSHLSSLPVEGTEMRVNLCTKQGYTATLSALEEAQIRVITDYPEVLSVPVRSGQVVGKIKVVLNDKELFSAPIYAIQSAETENLMDIIYKIISFAK